MNNLKYKTMRKLVFTLLMLLTLSLDAQTNNDVIQFMGIPVDGLKSEMISKLMNKGFAYNHDHDYLEGLFNGEQVEVYVHTNNELVDRIIVVSKYPVSETDIKIKFNNLVRQFENSNKYYSNNENQTIDEKVDISYEMSINSKRFEAVFYQYLTTKEEIEELIDYYNNNWDSIAYADDASIRTLTEMGLFKEDDKDFNIKSWVLITTRYNSTKNEVWFMINENQYRYNYYNLILYYDNLRNRPNGEDL